MEGRDSRQIDGRLELRMSYFKPDSNCIPFTLPLFVAVAVKKNQNRTCFNLKSTPDPSSINSRCRRHPRHVRSTGRRFKGRRWSARRRMLLSLRPSSFLSIISRSTVCLAQRSYQHAASTSRWKSSLAPVSGLPNSLTTRRMATVEREESPLSDCPSLNPVRVEVEDAKEEAPKRSAKRKCSSAANAKAAGGSAVELDDESNMKPRRSRATKRKVDMKVEHEENDADVSPEKKKRRRQKKTPEGEKVYDIAPIAEILPTSFKGASLFPPLFYSGLSSHFLHRSPGIRLPQHHPPHRFPLPHLLLPHLPPLHPHLPRPPTPPHPRPPKPTRPAAHPLLERNAQHHPLPPLLRSLPLRQPRAPRLHARVRRRRA